MPKRKLRKRIKYFFLFIFVKTLIGVTNFIPRVWVVKFCGFLGRVGYRLVDAEREKAIKNLSVVYGEEKSPAEIERMAKKVFENIGKNAGDIFRGFPIDSMERLKKFTTIEGEQHLEKAAAKGKGVITLTVHLGAFEFVGAYLGLAGYNPLVIGTPLKDERLNDLLWQSRTLKGAIAIERGKETVKVIRGLKSGGTVIILIDQDTKVKSIFIDFMGKPAATPIGGTLLALKTGAAVVPLYITLQENYRQHITILPEVQLMTTGDLEIDLVTNTKVLSDVSQEIIKKHPLQWVWMHERWKTKPGEEIK